MERRPKSEKVLKGLGVSSGVGIGMIHIRERGTVEVPEYRITANRVATERERLKDAVTRSRRQIGRLRSRANAKPGAAGEELGFLLDAYFHMLKDSRLVRDADRRISEQRINAEAALQATITEIGEAFTAMNDPYVAARMVDIREVGNRVMRNLTKTPAKPLSVLPRGCVVAAEEMTPAETARLDRRRVCAIVAVLGGAQGHTAIMARALGIPTVLGVPSLLASIRSGDDIVVDGDTGEVVVNPTPETVAAFKHRRAERKRDARRLKALRRQPAVTRDGEEVILQANVELPIEMELVNQVGAAGIGLLRSEFIFMNRRDVPSEDEQYQALRQMVEAMGGKPATIRTLDLGGDKATAALFGEYGNSAASGLGLRGIRMSLSTPDMFDTQLRAILRAGAHGPIRIMLPMVIGVSEVQRVRKAMHRAARRLRSRGLTVADPLPPVGVTIEVPGAALAADALAQASDFFSIGSNDLTMYTLAIDRSDKQVADLYDPLHPAVLRMIQFSAAAGLRARIPIGICGEMAGDPRYTALLLGLGLRDLSMTPANIPRVKRRIRHLDLAAANRRTRVIMDQIDPARIAALLDDFNALDLKSGL